VADGATPVGRIEIVGLTKRFGEVTAVDNISIDITGGEFFSMVGPSGCGKTTTLRMIAGFERPDDGEIRLDGVDMSATRCAISERGRRASRSPNATFS